ncbi:dynein axonemal heavy chain 8-like [Stegostoma tigrinum]|nr:dynein axonemal heavy chain 8-like [Stegostoma tigrinum]
MSRRGDSGQEGVLPNVSRSSILDSYGSEKKTGKFRRSTVGVVALQETIKEKQVRYREARESRRLKFDDAYQYIIDILSRTLEMEKTIVEDFILDSLTFQVFDDFFSKGGTKSLVFFYQEAEPPVIESGRIIAGLSKGSKMMRLFQSDFSSVCLTGLCLFFVRYKTDIAITGKNIHEEIYFCVLDCTDGILSGAEKMLGNIFVHAISASDKWGALNQSIHGHREKKAFKDIIRRYVRFLNGALTSLEKAVVLKSETVDLSQLRSFEQVTAAASNPEIILQLENVLLMWHNQLEQVLAQSNQVRKEAEDSGPLTELEHWKCTSAKFNSIIEQLKGQHCKAVINVLNTSHSKMLKMWLELDSQITDAANEAKDNVKFLQALEKVCQPLYNSDPVTMTRGVPNLINTIQMIHNVSRYYNTSQQITSLFIKITNQMVTACREYITEDGTARVWDQDSEVVINKMKECKKLLVEYRKYFQNTKKYTTETAQDNPFDVSEMYIFGKLEVFCKRLAKITEMVEAVKTFSALKNSTIEGIEILAIKFQNIYLNLKKTHYDILDPRKKEFNSDYAVFMKQVFDLENLLNDFMSNSFAQIISSRHSLQLLKRFQSLNIPSLESEIEVIVERIIQHYAGELMFVNKHYQINKEDPPLARNMPPIAGKILWVRQLFKRIHEPIDYFYKSSHILKSPQGMSIVRKYNKIAYVLVKFETLYHKAWIKEISAMQYMLQATLLVRDPETGKLYSNFDHRIFEILRESKCMLKMDLEIPEIAKRLLKMENTLKSNCNNLESVLHAFETVCQRIPSEFMALITPKVNKIESILSQGVTLLNWSSLTLGQFFADVNTAINELITLLKTLTDLREMHIDEVLYEIAQKIMINLPEDHTLTLEDMVAYNEMFLLISKVMEEIIYNAVKWHLQKNNLLTEDHFRFDEGHRPCWLLWDRMASRGKIEIVKFVTPRLALLHYTGDHMKISVVDNEEGSLGLQSNNDLLLHWTEDWQMEFNPDKHEHERQEEDLIDVYKVKRDHAGTEPPDPPGSGSLHLEDHEAGRLLQIASDPHARLRGCHTRRPPWEAATILGIAGKTSLYCLCLAALWKALVSCPLELLLSKYCNWIHNATRVSCREWADILAPKAGYIEKTVNKLVDIFIEISEIINDTTKSDVEPGYQPTPLGFSGIPRCSRSPAFSYSIPLQAFSLLPLAVNCSRPSACSILPLSHSVPLQVSSLLCSGYLLMTVQGWHVPLKEKDKNGKKDMKNWERWKVSSDILGTINITAEEVLELLECMKSPTGQNTTRPLVPSLLRVLFFPKDWKTSVSSSRESGWSSLTHLLFFKTSVIGDRNNLLAILPLTVSQHDAEKNTILISAEDIIQLDIFDCLHQESDVVSSLLSAPLDCPSALMQLQVSAKMSSLDISSISGSLLLTTRAYTLISLSGDFLCMTSAMRRHPPTTSLTLEIVKLPPRSRMPGLEISKYFPLQPNRSPMGSQAHPFPIATEVLYPALQQKLEVCFDIGQIYTIVRNAESIYLRSNRSSIPCIPVVWENCWTFAVLRSQSYSSLGALLQSAIIQVMVKLERRRVVFTETPQEENAPFKIPIKIKEDNQQIKKNEELEKDIKELYAYFSHQLLDALVKSTHLSLEIFKRRVFKRGLYGYSNNVEEFAPFLKAEVRLAIPNVVMIPNLDDIQHGINRIIQMILEVSRKVQHWRQSKSHLESIYEAQNVAGEYWLEKQERHEIFELVTIFLTTHMQLQGLAQQSCFRVEGKDIHKATYDAVFKSIFQKEYRILPGGNWHFTMVQFSKEFFRKNIGFYLAVTGILPECRDYNQVSQVDFVEFEFPEINESRNLRKPKNFYHNVAEHKDVTKLVAMLSTSVNTTRDAVVRALEQFQRFNQLWLQDRDMTVKKFMDSNPSLYELRAKIEYYAGVEREIEELSSIVTVDFIELNTEPIKLALLVEAKAWKKVLCRFLNEQYKEKMAAITAFIVEEMKNLARPIQDLDDVRFAMESLSQIRNNEIQMDMTLGPIEEAYSILNKYGIEISKEETEEVDTLRYFFNKLQVKARNVQDELVQVQPKFKANLLESVDVFQKEVLKYGRQYEKEGPMVPGIAPAEASTRLQIFQSWFDELWRKFVTYSSGERLFGLPVQDYEILQKNKKELSLLQKLYSLYDAVMNNINGYYDVLWTELDIEKINAELLDFQNRCRRLPKGLKEWQAFLDLKKKIDDFSESCPLLEMMSNKSMQPRHWDRISAVTGHKFNVTSETFSLKNVMDAPLLQFKDDIEDICISSVKEKDIEAKLNQVMQTWTSQTLSFSSFKNRGDLLLKGLETAEIIMLMEDSLMILSSLLSNRYNTYYKKDIQLWVHNLTACTIIIEQWLLVQNLWIYLEAVFVGGDIAKQLPQEAKRFQNVDKSWIKIMQRAHEIPIVVQCCVGDDIMGQLLPHLQEQLEVCQKSLTGYLEKKRLLFPRFFFVSDPALLEILGQASDSHTIQAHLAGIFDNVNEAVFHPKEYDTILAVTSREGEKIHLDRPVIAKGPVELWLSDLLRVQQASLHTVIKLAYYSFSEPDFQLIPFLYEAPGQVGILAIQILWTRDSEDALRLAKDSKKIMQTTNQKFLELLNSLIAQTTHDLTKFQRIQFETLVTIHVHQRDIFDDLVKMHIRTVSDFEWLKQSRFYFNDDTQEIKVRITDVEFIYQNEFLGCTDRLVITPLTDRCYITLAQALWMNMGAAPAGPAGTGKTETVKDMGKALGKYVVVFNCSDQMDFRGLGRIYKGLAQSGSWGCFDEFNRIELPVLSVAAQQIYIILMARKERKKQFIFTDGDNVSLNPEFGIFITMNPGYAGRQELPENLKIQFRTVAMMVPDRQIIIRVKLASVGFLDNVMLAQKFFVLYKLCEEQLTKQVHYDFGLRNILSVLRTLGAQKRARPEDSEQTIVMRVLRDMNLSKLVDEDEPLFLSLISDLFPGIQLDSSTYVELQAAVANQVEIAGLVNHPPWNLKLVQLYETARVRHGLMTLGPSGSGKTCVIRTLMHSLTECGAPHREMRMNPKAITAPQMFGRLDPATNDWTDGIFSTLWRKSIKSKKGDNIWIILDGPVDAIWIENLNSVLDDNKTLTLANGDRIPMAPSCKLLFEVHNIENASPATVSRMGMVYISSSALSWQPILKAWLNKRIPWEAEILQNLYNISFEDAYLYMKLNLHPVMELLECNYIVQSITLLEGLMEVGMNVNDVQLRRLFVFGLMWSIGALLELDSRAKLEKFLRTHDSKLDLPDIPAGSPETMFEFLVNQQGEWENWKIWVQEYSYPPDSEPDYTSILVPNVDNVRTNFLLDIIAKQNKAVLLTGEQGTAKTVMIKAYLKRYDPEVHLSKSLNFSSATEPYMFQRTVESYVEKRVGSTYGPPSGRKMTIFIDDINMPVINEWGDQITNEIVRQMIEMHGMYNLDKPGDFTKIVDVQLMAAMIHPGGGRNDIPQRLKRQFSIFNCTLPTNASIDKIFGIIGNGYFQPSRNFIPSICNMISKLVPASRILWQWTKVKMLPTPAKFHYIFNLRDLSRIWQGMLNIMAEECSDLETLLALFKHECTRVIADRFVSEEDRYWFENAVTRVVEDNIGRQLAEKLHKEPYFVDFLRDLPEPTGDEPDDYVFVVPKIYEMIPSYEFLTEKLQFYQRQHNEGVRSGFLDLVFFKDAMTHIMKISRIIRTDCGNALLVGVGGSGKQSFTKLASYIAGYKIFQITLTRAYSVTNLMDDLKILYRTAGAEGKGITFIFTDNDIKEESFLEYLNNVLSSGEVSNLFARDELDEITQSLIAPMKKEAPRIPPTVDNLYEYFIKRARKNLHVVLCFSPVGEKFRSRAMKFPGLISGCTMDWFSRWPREALVAVSHYFLSGFYIACSAEVKTQLVSTMGVFHDKVYQTCEDYFQRYRRRTHITPKSYLAFINSYKTIYKEKHVNINDLAEHMQLGLSKLMEATESVALLAKELAGKEKELAAASRNADKVLGEVTVSAQAAELVKNEVLIVKNKAQKIVEEIEADKNIAEGKLIAAKPALEAAEAALNTIKPADISTVRKLAKPPHLIMRILDCVLILFQKKMDTVTMDPERPCLKPSWGESLKLLSGTGFLQALQQFPKDTINDETVELLQPYFMMEDYTFEHAKKVCGNVAGLLSWTQAMASFFAINKEVLPLKANLAVQENRLQRAMKELGNAQAQLDEKQAELDKVQAKFDAAMKEKMDLLEDAETCRRKMEAASALIDGLSGEKIRWTEQCKEFKAQINRLVGDVLLATGFLSYSGPFNQTFRDILLKVIWEVELQKKKIPYSDSLNIIAFLVDQAMIGEWNLQGLPSDDLSVQNGIIVTKATRYPLLIDPQTQGKTWIKRKEKDNELQVTSLNHKYFRNHLEDCLSLGRPLLLEDVQEELDPALDNVLEKNFIKSGTAFKVKVGDKEIDVMAGFMFYITTKLPNPAYTPEISAKTSIIDFTVTIKGLENQLLGRVILTEKQELEAERVQLIEEVTANKRKMKELENNLLFKLSTTKGSLVDDESLIGVLQVTKTTATEVSEKLHVAAETEIKINTAQEEYRPAATRGSILYFLITEMSMVNMMYQTSLAQFLKLFDLSMARSKKSPVAAKRIRSIIEYLTYEVFKYSVRGLYENHKFLFTLLLPLKINLERGYIKYNEFQTLIKGGAALDLKASPQKPFRWILDMTWLNLVELSKLAQFAEILTQISKNEKAWKVWFDAEAPEEEIIPNGYSDSLDAFCKLLLIRSWCPDRILSQARNYIAEAMEAKYAEPVILNLETTWEESDAQTPLICFLSMGSDPSNQIEGLAKKLEIDCRAISMGQGQEVHARKLVAMSMHQGGWVLLQNCHLGLAFMDELLETLLISENVHDSFRVWLTTEPHPKFPITLLQTSIKYTNEPPQGVRAGLKRTFTGITQDQIEYSNLPMWRPLLYAVAFLHTTVQERRKFGPLGWCIPYEFNSSDFTASVQFIQNHLDDCDKKKGVSWNTIRYMLGEVQYGGRVTDDYDKRLLNCFCKVWFNEKMFDSKFSFYTDYIIPICASVESYLEYIQTLPAVDTPQVFGLHPNADITYQSNTAAEILNTITNIQPKESAGGGGETREATVFKLADSMLLKLPPDYLAHEVKARLIKMGILNSMNIFLRQEIDRMQRVITMLRNCLNDLKLAIEGTIIMSENLTDALDNMYNARVPVVWKRISWDSSTLGFWFTEFLERNAQFSSWIFEGRPSVFWMPGFFNPQGFLTAMRQEVTRAHKGWALDSVTLHNEVTKLMKDEIKLPPPEGVYIYGLYLDGAGWDRRNIRLTESTAKVLFTMLPVIYIFAINSTASKDPKLYICPVYKKPQRTDLTFITALCLKTVQPPDHWILRGAALLCDIK